MSEKKLKKTFVLLSLGANIGDKESTLESAIAKLIEIKAITDLVKSSYYKTEPFGVKNQDWFVNICISGFTELSPLQLLDKCKLIEKMYGRQERDRWHEREIDIDIIFYGKEIIETTSLTIPHREFSKRNFVLIPASEIAGQFIPPNGKTNLSEMASQCKDDSLVEKIN